jgi:putative nucleotidyltransferase with HDIG domain
MVAESVPNTQASRTLLPRLLDLLERPSERALHDALEEIARALTADVVVLGRSEGQLHVPSVVVGAVPPALAAAFEHGVLLRQASTLFGDSDEIQVQANDGTPVAEALSRLGLTAVLSRVFQSEGQSVGVTLHRLAGSTQGFGWNPAERALLRGACQVIAALLAQREHRKANMRAFESAIFLLGHALELRDGVTGEHTNRVARLADAFGRYLGLDDPQLLALRWGAYLHDLGKFAIPDPLLQKPAPLTQAEFEVMQGHTVLGDEMSFGLAFLPRAARAIIRHHHERWDGFGYPDQLRGLGIPPLARLFAVCDVYDVLTAGRPYREPLAPFAALVELQRGAHSGQFEPDAVARFLAFAAESGIDALSPQFVRHG